MTSERMRRRIDALLDEADEAVSARRWDEAAEKARAVLTIEPDNADAQGYPKMADVNLGTAVPVVRDVAIQSPAPTAPTSPEPTSFANSRYEVKRFLEGGKKKVYLAHDAQLDSEFASPHSHHVDFAR